MFLDGNNNLLYDSAFVSVSMSKSRIRLKCDGQVANALIGFHLER